MTSLDRLIDHLNSFTGQIPIDELLPALEQLEVDWPAIEPHLRFHHERYQRNLLAGSEHYHALLLCWKAGQRSPIHDHRASNCGFRVLCGTATESNFLKTEHGLVYPTGSRDLPQGSICASADADIHQVSNLHLTDDLVTLHIYSPPLLVMGQYSLMSTQVTDFVDPVFEYSLGGGI